MALIKECLCGQPVYKNDMNFAKFYANEVPLLRCHFCGAIHQEVSMSEDEYYAFYSEDYHDKQRSEQGFESLNSKERYADDYAVAEKRFDLYSCMFSVERILRNVLDIGASNGAFVDYIRTQQSTGQEAWGLEIGASGDDRAIKYRDTIDKCNIPDNSLSLVTMHDVFEHLIDPRSMLKQCKRILQRAGVLVIDIPDYFSPAGKKHIRKVEHLWYLDQAHMERIASQEGFRAIHVVVPIEGKRTFIFSKDS